VRRNGGRDTSECCTLVKKGEKIILAGKRSSTLSAFYFTFSSSFLCFHYAPYSHYYFYTFLFSLITSPNPKLNYRTRQGKE